jgi:hypothetical protein
LFKGDLLSNGSGVDARVRVLRSTLQVRRLLENSFPNRIHRAPI